MKSTTQDLTQFAQICQKAARAGGHLLVQMQDQISVREKGTNDLVTDADIQSQKVITEIIKSEFPDHGILGEEDLGDSETVQLDADETSYRWIVDPLDGTVNYVHGLQSYSVSIALALGQQLLVGAVFDPVLDEMFFARADSQATLNNQPIQHSGCREISKSLIVVSLPAKSSRESPEVERMLRLVESAQSLRRLGSAALNLCYIAAGRVDAYVATSVNAWDVAAGTLIANQSNSIVRHIDDKKFDLNDPRIIAASTPDLWQQIHHQCVV